MEYRELKYEGHDHTSVKEGLFEINDNLQLFGEEVGKFLVCEMTWRIIPKTLKMATSLKVYNKGSEDLQNRDKIIELCCKISTLLKREADANHDNHDNHNGNRTQNDRNDSNVKKQQGK